MSDIQEADRPGDKGSQEFTPQIAFAMGEIKGTVENLRTDLKEWKGEFLGKNADLELRVRALEKWKWMVAGAAAAGGLAGGKLLELLAKMASQ